MVSRMYEGVKTWNPFVGCRFNCVYCTPSFQRQAKRRKRWCERCYRYEPHFHPERIKRLPNAETIFACAYGDIAFAERSWIEEILHAIESNSDRTFYIQTKRPSSLVVFKELGKPKNLKLGITLETNQVNYNIPSIYKSYEQISQAPSPVERVDTDFGFKRALIDYVTIEPILDFSDDFAEDIKWIGPEFVYIGYDNHNCKLPEPPLEKTLELIEKLKSFTEVRLKTIRREWYDAQDDAV